MVEVFFFLVKWSLIKNFVGQLKEKSAPRKYNSKRVETHMSHTTSIKAENATVPFCPKLHSRNPYVAKKSLILHRYKSHLC